MNLSVYLPQDRLRALARGESLPDRTTGTALFADISGFTLLTEQLRDTLGSRRGIEALTSQINAVYTALIAEIERYDGSVISFAGDAVMCWFDDKNERGTKDERSPTAACAVACGLAMQAAMTQFPELGLKVAIAGGLARRFLVGDPDIHYIDALAGETVTRAAAAERLASQGEVLADKATIVALGTAVTVDEWREADGEQFAVVSQQLVLNSQQWVVNSEQWTPADERIKPYIIPAVYRREIAGQGSFLTEFRPCVVWFVRFSGLDYEADDAQVQLDGFIRQLQKTASHYDGVLLQLIIGDKGSYAYINFGALSAHEDDGRRAVKAALELAQVSTLPLQMGVAQGMMRVGVYGGVTRRTYGALGDDVNLAARLMATAGAGEILLSGGAQKLVADEFVFEPRPPLPMKGKAESLPVFAVTGKRKQRAIRLQEPVYALPMVGRQAELQQIEEKLALAAEGKSQVIGIIAEAGLGKSRLVAEVVRAAHKKGFTGYGGACQSDAISTPYHAWKSIWQAFFDVDPEMPLRKLMRNLEGKIQDRAPLRVAAMPLLNVLLGLNMPENDFTRTLEPKTRQSALHALLEDCLKAAAQDEPLLIVIEDVHWMDALSHDLLAQLAQATARLPVCFALAYRPPQLARLAATRLESLPQFTRIELQALTPGEAEQAIRAKLAQLYPLRGGALPTGLAATLMARSQGNPFYLEELLNYVHDRGLDPAELDSIELPDSLHTLILSRIDQLSEGEKSTLRVASIVGRLFRADWLMGYYPELGAFPQVKESLEQLHRLDITPLESPEPELAYLFKHIVTHEVTYESLPFATRAQLHERLAAYLERVYAETAPLETLAFHYGRSDNQAKQIEYLRRAGEAAQNNFANDAALDFYERVLSLLSETEEKIKIQLKRGEVLELMGQWAEAESDYRAALELAHDSAEKKAGAQFALGKLNRLRGEYETALNWLAQAREIQLASNDGAGLAKTLIETGMVLWHQGAYAEARERLNEGLALARQAGVILSEALALNNLGIVAWRQGDYAAARALFDESLSLKREMGDKQGVAGSLNNLGLVALFQGDYAAARVLYEENLSLFREMGDKWGVSVSLNNLGLVALDQGDYAAARTLLEESLSLKREVGDKWGIALLLDNLGYLDLLQGDTNSAQALFIESLTLNQEMGIKDIIIWNLIGLAAVAGAMGNNGRAVHLAAAAETLRAGVGGILLSLQRGVYEKAVTITRAALGEEAFAAAWTEGERWSLEEATAYALEETPDPA